QYKDLSQIKKVREYIIKRRLLTYKEGVRKIRFILVLKYELIIMYEEEEEYIERTLQNFDINIKNVRTKKIQELFLCPSPDSLVLITTNLPALCNIFT